MAALLRVKRHWENPPGDRTLLVGKETGDGDVGLNMIFYSELVKMLTRWPHGVPQRVRLAAAAGAFIKAAIDPRPNHLHRQLTRRTFI